MSHSRSSDKPSWQAGLFGLAIKARIRRESWGTETELARRARRLFGAPRPYGWLRTRGLTIRASRYPAIQGEWIGPATEHGPVVLYVHGGGFVSCSATTHRPITAGLARLTQAAVFAVDYRLAPEHRYPAALDDVMAAYACVLEDAGDPMRIAVVGDSAGGNLALGLMLRARDTRLPLPACAVVLSPWLDLTGSGASVWENNGRCAMFRPRNIADFAAACTGSREPPSGYCSPLTCHLGGLSPILFQVGADELLRDDSVRAHEAILRTGGHSKLEIYAGVFHGWHMLDGLVPEARQALIAAGEFIRVHVRIAARVSDRGPIEADGPGSVQNPG